MGERRTERRTRAESGDAQGSPRNDFGVAREREGDAAERGNEAVADGSLGGLLAYFAGFDGSDGGFGIGGVEKKIQKRPNKLAWPASFGPPGWRWPSWLASATGRLEEDGEGATETGDDDGG